jgi:hypothetical protein
LLRSFAADLFTKTTSSLSSSSSSSDNRHTHVSFSGNNPPYFTTESASFIRQTLGCNHIICDLPSVDRENDEGKLIAHHIFLDDFSHKSNNKDSNNLTQPNSPSIPRTVTELAWFPSESKLSDGPYLLDLQISPLKQDAAPSRPVIYNATLLFEDK